MSFARNIFKMARVSDSDREVQRGFDRARYRRDMSELIGSFFNWFGVAWKELPEIEKKLKDLPGTNFRVAERFFREGRFADALLRYRIVLWLQPRHVTSMFRAGRCYHALGNNAKAAECYRKALQMKPDLAEATFMLAVLDQKEIPNQKVPLSLVVEQFDRLAPFFRQHYVDRAGYTGHIAAEKAVTDWVSQRMASQAGGVQTWLDVVELGCGCGVTGERVRNYAQHMVGVDISKVMLANIPQPTLAPPAPGEPALGGKPVYDKVFNEDIETFLTRQAHGVADLVVAAGVFNYVGDIAGIAQCVGTMLRPGGAFIFSVERLTSPLADAHAVAWVPARTTFGHRADYIRDVCRKAGLQESSMVDIMLYRNAPGYQCVFVKPGGAAAQPHPLMTPA